MPALRVKKLQNYGLVVLRIKRKKDVMHRSNPTYDANYYFLFPIYSLLQFNAYAQ
jgi:hypothetical protein